MKKIKAFCEAQFVGQPFTFRLKFLHKFDAENIENEKISNRRTNEVLSIDFVRFNDWMVGMARWYEGKLEIKRTIGKNK